MNRCGKFKKNIFNITFCLIFVCFRSGSFAETNHGVVTQNWTFYTGQCSGFTSSLKSANFVFSCANYVVFWPGTWSHIAYHLVLLLVVVVVVDVLIWAATIKKFKSQSFQIRWDEIWQDCPSSEYASISIVGFWIWRHTFKMAVKWIYKVSK